MRGSRPVDPGARRHWPLARPLHAQNAPPAIAVLPFENTGSYGQDKENFEALEVGLPAILGVHRWPRIPAPGWSDRARRPRGDAIAASSARPAHRRRVRHRRWPRRRARGTPSPAASPISTASSGSTPRVVDAQIGRDPEGRLQRRPEAAGPRPARRDPAAGRRAHRAAARPAALSRRTPRRGARAVPTEALTDYSRGLMFEGRGDRAKAAEAFQRALTAYPDYPEARDGLQRVERALGRTSAPPAAPDRGAEPRRSRPEPAARAR